MEYLEKYYPETYKEIKDYNLDDRNYEKYKLIENKDKSLNIIINNKMYLHSRYNPIKEAKIWIEGITLENEDSIIILGLGLGYYLQDLVEKFKGKKIIIIEPEIHIFYKSIKMKDYSRYISDDNIVFIINHDKYTVRSLIEHYIKNRKIKNIYFAHLPSYNNMYEEYISDLYKQIRSLVKLMEGNLYTEIISSKRWVYNILRNIKFIPKNSIVDKVKDIIKNVPIIIISAGPSLENNIHLLNKVKEKAIIIAVGSAVNILEKNNIQPNIILAIDGNKAEGNIFKNAKNHNPLLIYDNVIYYESLLDYSGPKMWLTLKSDKYMDRFCEKLEIKSNKFLTGGSVANLALDFGKWVEATYIIFLGQDLCYTKEKLYADGAVHQEHIENKDKYIIEKDIYGKEVYTKSAFLNFKSWFEDYVNYNKLNKGIFNCTEGGLPILGVPNISFQEVIDNYLIKEYNIEEKMNYLHEIQANISMEAYEELICKYELELDRCLVLSKERIKLLTELESKCDESNFYKMFDKITEKTNELEEIDFYKDFTDETDKLYRQAIEIGTYNALDQIDDVVKKRERLLLGLKVQYENIDEILEVAVAAINEEEIEELF
ncbi:motility associated factor glycosyltransferase family protein [Alkaliphilus oremlandii]|nr:6-hydroxymethylpterin diphosphokinase MptE-like protein [Alkaliphilus oremlandii]